MLLTQGDSKMNVRTMMTATPAFCNSEADLGSAVELLWNCNVGFLPVVDSDHRVVSVITDRDICIALGTRNRLAGEILVGEVATHEPICCRADDDIRTALDLMAEAGVRRLPVVSDDNRLEGILSMDDVVEETPSKNASRGDGNTADEVFNALKMICSAQVPKYQGLPRQRSISRAA
jgi:CBS domain-containing protein